MNLHEAKFLLRAARPNGADAADAIFAEPLAEAARNPQLRAWLEQEHAVDAALAAKLSAVAPPEGLREAILAGARASQRSRPAWRRPLWQAVAALFAVLLVVAGRFAEAVVRGPSVEELAVLALRDLATAHAEHDGRPPPLAAEQARLASVALPLRGKLDLNVRDLERKHCRSVRIDGHEVFEICFDRDGAWYHLYVTRGGASAPGELLERETAGSEPLAVAAWSEAQNSYAIVTRAGTAALRRLL